MLGLLVGLALCYGVMSYALTNALQNRETASEQTEAVSERTVAREKTSPVPATTAPSPPSDTRTVTVRVTGFGGEPFSGELGTLESKQPVTGTVLTDYELQVRTSSPPADSVFATIQKTAGDNNLLIVQILDAGVVVRGESTTAPYGSVSLTWSPAAQ